jgi:hypothetical protein
MKTSTFHTLLNLIFDKTSLFHSAFSGISISLSLEDEFGRIEEIQNKEFLSKAFDYFIHHNHKVFAHLIIQFEQTSTVFFISYCFRPNESGFIAEISDSLRNKYSFSSKNFIESTYHALQQFHSLA